MRASLIYRRRLTVPRLPSVFQSIFSVCKVNVEQQADVSTRRGGRVFVKERTCTHGEGVCPPCHIRSDLSFSQRKRKIKVVLLMFKSHDSKQTAARDDKKALKHPFVFNADD